MPPKTQTIPKEDSKSNFKPYCHLGFYFIFSILWCSWSDNHTKDDLARFGYRLDMKIEKNQNPSIFLLGLIIKIWQFGNLYFPKSSKFGPIFFPLKILCIGWNIFFRSKFGKISSNWKKNCCHSYVQSVSYIFFFKIWKLA
jgi:hypothetical protein